MSRGRCAGCGLEDASCKKVRSHVATCDAFRELWLSDPSRALDPEEEAERHRAYRESLEGQTEREEVKATKAARYRAEAEAKIERARERWGKKP